MSFRPERRARKPLNQAKLQELALAYVARFATSTARLEAYLARKLRERGWEGETPPAPEELAARLAELGYVNDEAFARARAGGMLRRGYGMRRIAAALRDAGIPAETSEALEPDKGAIRQAALTMARKRGFGPFGRAAPDAALRQKHIAAMLRAGHDLDHVRFLIDAESPEMAEEWAQEIA